MRGSRAALPRSTERRPEGVGHRGRPQPALRVDDAPNAHLMAFEDRPALDRAAMADPEAARAPALDVRLDHEAVVIARGAHKAGPDVNERRICGETRAQDALAELDLAQPAIEA